jgi:hypothetical protein
MVELPALEPTCTEDGHYAYEECSECGYTTYEIIPAFGHSIIINFEEAPSCENDGARAHYECDECGLFFADEEGVTVVSKDSVILQKTGHLDKNKDFLCDNRCGKILFTEEVLNTVLSNTLALSKVTVRDYYFPTASNTYYYISNDKIRIAYDTGDDGEIINREEGADEFNIGSVLSEKYNLGCASEILFSVCLVKEFENRPMFKYNNSDGISIALVLNADADILDGMLIYDENGNIIHEILITLDKQSEN